MHRIWSTDWFRNPVRETGKLIAAIRNAAEQRIRPEVLLPLPPENEPEPGDGEMPVYPPPQGQRERPSNVKQYEELPLAVPRNRELLNLSIGEIGRLAQQVVEAEGPIHTEEVARRIREAFGLQQTGRRILAHVTGGLRDQQRSGAIQGKEDFWQIVGRETIMIRNRRNAELSIRKAAHIAPSEYQLALLTALKDAVAITRSDLLVQTARLFGFDRTGPDLKIEIERNLDLLIKDARIRQEDEMLVCGETAGTQVSGKMMPTTLVHAARPEMAGPADHVP